MAKFHVDKRTTVQVQMMYELNQFYSFYDRDLSTTAVRLDFNDSFSMILALPSDLSVLQEAMGPHHIAKWNRQMSKRSFEFC